MMGSVSTIESLGLVDGPGIRCVIFLNHCKLRCLYCHNPETWKMGTLNYTKEQLVDKIKRYKPYFNKDGGVTFSGGEPLLQPLFLIETAKLLREENIHIALDTAGVGTKYDEEVLKVVDLVILDIKHVTKEGYKKLTGFDIKKSIEFIDILNKSNKEVWLRQVIVPGHTDKEEYILKFIDFIKRYKNVSRVEFIPYHKHGTEKYEELLIENKMTNIESMDIEKTNELYKFFLKNTCQS